SRCAKVIAVRSHTRQLFCSQSHIGCLFYRESAETIASTVRVLPLKPLFLVGVEVAAGCLALDHEAAPMLVTARPADCVRDLGTGRAVIEDRRAAFACQPA